MTQKENQILFELLGEFKESRKNNDERHAAVLDAISGLDSKIDSGHQQQQEEIKELDKEITGEEGIKVRLNKIEGLIKNGWRTVKWVGTSSGFLGLLAMFKDKLVLLKEQLIAIFHL